MSVLVEKSIPVKALLLGLRAMGYSFSTAVADIIDNCITAEATEVNVYSNSVIENPYFCIIDNGYGMTCSELDNAMLLGSDRTNRREGPLELGRFGLGLKSASLSQCREFIVASKNNGIMNAMSFDCDIIERENKMLLKQLSDEEINDLPEIDHLKAYASGTIVIWRKFDKIENLAKSFEDTFRSAVAASKKHVELVFHRFYDRIKIFYNNRRIERRDPFLLKSLGRTLVGRTSTINVKEANIIVTPYTLPFSNTLTKEEKDLLGNPSSLSEEQGFYLYRNERLISWGSWMHMGVRSEFNKLARIQVDIPSSLDNVWMLDVKKSTAKIPDKIKDRIRIAVEDSMGRSKRVTKFPGIKEQSLECKIWNRINERDGNVRYEINRESPVLVTLSSSLEGLQRSLLETALAQIEDFLPKYSIANDGMDSLTIVNGRNDLGDETLIEEIVGIVSACEEEKRSEIFDRLFFVEGYRNLINRKEEIRRRAFSHA